MRMIQFFMIAITFLTACKSKDSYNLHGTIEGLSNQQMFLQQVTFNNIVDIDTATSDASGKYEFKGKVSEPGWYRISASGKYWMLRLANENLQYDAKFSDDLLKEVKIKGSKEAEAFQNVINTYIEARTELSDLQQQYQTKQMAQVSNEELKAIEDQFAVAEQSITDKIKAIIDNTEDPVVGIYALTGLNSDKEMDYINAKISDYDKSHPNSTYVKDIKAKIAEVAQQKAAQEQAQAMAAQVGIGKPAPDFTQKMPNGQDLSLSSLKGQVVLIDFWASWCKPCRMENPNVVAAYNAFKDKGFTVLSVSLDKERDAWVAAIEQDGLVWPNHVSDLQFWNNAAAQLYGVQSIPAAFLVDKDGVIVAKDLRGVELEAKLKEVL